jgi:hypothetical protein
MALAGSPPAKDANAPPQVKGLSRNRSTTCGGAARWMSSSAARSRNSASSLMV